MPAHYVSVCHFCWPVQCFQEWMSSCLSCVQPLLSMNSASRALEWSASFHSQDWFKLNWMAASLTTTSSSPTSWISPPRCTDRTHPALPCACKGQPQTHMCQVLPLHCKVLPNLLGPHHKILRACKRFQRACSSSWAPSKFGVTSREMLLTRSHHFSFGIGKGKWLKICDSQILISLALVSEHHLLLTNTFWG